MSEKDAGLCKVKLLSDPEKGWKLVLDELSPACEASLKRVAENLGPEGKKFLGKRIETLPELKRILDAMGLTSESKP